MNGGFVFDLGVEVHDDYVFIAVTFVLLDLSRFMALLALGRAFQLTYAVRVRIFNYGVFMTLASTLVWTLISASLMFRRLRGS